MRAPNFHEWLTIRGEADWLDQELGLAADRPLFYEPMDRVSLGLFMRVSALDPDGTTARELVGLSWGSRFKPKFTQHHEPTPRSSPGWCHTLVWQPRSLPGWGAPFPDQAGRDEQQAWRDRIEALENHIDLVERRLNEAVASWNPTRAVWNGVLCSRLYSWQDEEAIVRVLTAAAKFSPAHLAARVSCLVDFPDEYKPLHGWEAWLGWRGHQSQRVRVATADLIPDEYLAALW